MGWSQPNMVGGWIGQLYKAERWDKCIWSAET